MVNKVNGEKKLLSIKRFKVNVEKKIYQFNSNWRGGERSKLFLFYFIILLWRGFSFIIKTVGVFGEK